MFKSNLKSIISLYLFLNFNDAAIYYLNIPNKPTKKK